MDKVDRLFDRLDKQLGSRKKIKYHVSHAKRPSVTINVSSHNSGGFFK